jgi:hypothetical protein
VKHTTEQHGSFTVVRVVRISSRQHGHVAIVFCKQARKKY